jgi:hypothetical protein
MQAITEMAIEKASRGIFSRIEAAEWAGGGTARLDALLKRATASGEILRIRRSLYCLHDRYTRRRIDPYELAQLIHGPSYISLESALSLHGWIPEAVHAVTSVCSGRSRQFDTPLGLFTYTRVPQRTLLVGVVRTGSSDGGVYFLANPLKALADYVHAGHRDWTAADPLVRSLRIERDLLESLTPGDFDMLLEGYPSGRARRFLVGLREDLKV